MIVRYWRKQQRHYLPKEGGHWRALIQKKPRQPDLLFWHYCWILRTGKAITSRILAEFVRSITSLSIPSPWKQTLSIKDCSGRCNYNSIELKIRSFDVLIPPFLLQEWTDVAQACAHLSTHTQTHILTSTSVYINSVRIQDCIIIYNVKYCNSKKWS